MMNLISKMCPIIILLLTVCTVVKVDAQTKPGRAFLEFEYDTITGIGHEEGLTRRDPSDVILVDGVYYVYYTKVYGRAPGYWGTIWYATSTDEGYTWEEQGELLGAGAKGSFDSHAVFTPNIIESGGTFYLYYTGVKPTPGNPKGEFENNSTTDITALGVAVSDSPTGPFERISDQPVLTISVEPEKFDSYRIDDASLLYRNGLYWLYYKGRSRVDGDMGPRKTHMGVAYSHDPQGPFTKYPEPILGESHEVMIWPEGYGVSALASFSNKIVHAPEGVDFNASKDYVMAKNRPDAPGAFRPDLTQGGTSKEGLQWGIGMVHNGDEAYLIRFSVVE
ncbi:family 43 glycosylhydrolase [Echinicola sediminis]